MGPDEFADEVARVIRDLPPQIAAEIRNVSFGVEEGVENPNLLGVYRGVARTHRGQAYSFQLPDTITIFRLPIVSRCRTREEVVHQIEVTVKHEIGHYFGIGEDRLHELGWG
jgi:predicted Zn-dependent protease with MMP-like domain